MPSIVQRLRSRLSGARALLTTSYELAREMARLEGESDSGAYVTADAAMRTAAVYSCVRVLSEDIAALPFGAYRRVGNGREEITSGWLADLLRQPNAWQTSTEFRELVQAHVELHGNFFALKTVVREEVRELLPVSPQRVVVEQRKDWSLKYTISWPDGTSQEVPPDRIVHLRGLSIDGIRGLSPIGYMRETIGTAMQQQKYGARLFKNGAMVGGILEHPTELSDSAAKRLKESFDEKYTGVDNAHKVVLLEEGMKFNKTGMTAEDAQFIEAKKFSRSEIAGFYRVPPHLIADLDRATFSNIEQQSTNYVMYGLLPRLVRLESRLLLSLIPLAERATTFFKHNVNALLRADYATRMAGYQQAVQTGWMTRNEVRHLEDLNPGPAALDEFLDPAHITGKQDGNAGDPKKKEPPKPSDPSQPEQSGRPGPQLRRLV